MERQIQYLTQYCSAKGYRVVNVLSDVASGLKTNRRGLIKLFNYVVNKQVDVIVVRIRIDLPASGLNTLNTSSDNTV